MVLFRAKIKRIYIHVHAHYDCGQKYDYDRFRSKINIPEENKCAKLLYINKLDFD